MAANGTKAVYLIWLEWPERCFRADAESIRFLRSLVPPASRIVRARTEAGFLRALGRATHVVTWRFDGAWFAKAPRLRALATPAAGRELVSSDAPKGVRVHYGHFHGRIMAESVAAFMLAWRRGFIRLQREGSGKGPWPRTWLSDKCSTVAGSRAVILGFGNVGRAIGGLLERLGVEVTGVTRHGVFRGASRPRRLGPDGLGRALAAADWLVLALPSTTGTDDLLDAKLIRKLPRTCVVVNVGRGNAVDERALYAALSSGRLAGAYLDVRRHEPSASVLEAPGWVPELADLPNCVSTPHAAAFDGNYLKLCFAELKEDGIL